MPKFAGTGKAALLEMPVANLSADDSHLKYLQEATL